MNKIKTAYVSLGHPEEAVLSTAGGKEKIDIIKEKTLT